MIAVVCTGRDTHREKQLGWLVVERSPEDGSGGIAFVPWATHHQFRIWATGTPSAAPCGCCPALGGTAGERPRWTQANAVRLVDGLTAAGSDRLDVFYWTDRVL